MARQGVLIPGPFSLRRVKKTGSSSPIIVVACAYLPYYDFIFKKTKQKVALGWLGRPFKGKDKQQASPPSCAFTLKRVGCPSLSAATLPLPSPTRVYFFEGASERRKRQKRWTGGWNSSCLRLGRRGFASHLPPLARLPCFLFIKKKGLCATPCAYQCWVAKPWVRVIMQPSLT